MKVLAWLAFPLAATALAMCWAAWRGRSRGPRRSGGAFAAVEDFRRFSDALAAPGPDASPPRRRFGRAPRNASDTKGTDAAARSLRSARGQVGKKLGSAEKLGSTKTAGQGS
ncbi:hypothetical protein HPO96_24275 [Kribbella sandramycini]|uniref:Uncharacterized protein n=1 Tax=Kribbella sandramycini TaxID=60450 RepID=A0A7Y4P0P4_9ACTN|nr:hypothetical protein [Kribbella sandramycini]MBB6571227.1 hypothetical protein [Kribbella sandramycini]NOL43367.1 hypothetical protein [Kribbella sandramycini]